MRIFKIFVLFITIIFSFSGFCFSDENLTQPILLENGLIIDGTGNEPLTGYAILIQNGKIITIDKKEKIQILPDTRIIDVSGCTILPGLINAHVHNAYYEKHLSIWAQAGITTVRDLMTDVNNVKYALKFGKDSIKNPGFARVLSSGTMLTVPFGYMSNSVICIRNEKDAYEKAKYLLDGGADVIKLGFQKPDYFNFPPTLQVKYAKIITCLAKERNIPVTAHVRKSSDIIDAIDSGVTDIAHMVIDVMSDELIDRMVKNNIILEPTLSNFAASKGQERETVLANLKRFSDAGGIIALGAEHVPTAKMRHPFIGYPEKEFDMMIEAGLTPMQIIIASTRNAAQVCRLDMLLGTLKKGKNADILVVNGNPLENIKNLKNTKIVIHNGIIIREEK